MTTHRLTLWRKFILLIIALYLSFILMTSILSHLAEDNMRGKLSNGIYESHLTFPEDGVYGHYTKVVLFDKGSPGKIDLKYIFKTNILLIERVENIKELTIDCKLMFKNKCEEVFEKNPNNLEADYYKTYFEETNHGLFTVIVNTDTPMIKLQFVDIPIPVSVLVDNKEWWKTNTNYSIENGDDITISNIPEGSTTVKIYFQELEGKRPVAIFYADKYIIFADEEITFYGTDSYDPDGEILHYNWDFGDGFEISGGIVEHSYSDLGNYTVVLTVRDNDYLEDVAVDTIFVVNSTQDSDLDGVPDGLDPFPERNLDTDSDGLSDDFESVISKTNKRNKDTDGDGFDDKWEWDNGTDPNDPNDPKAQKKSEKESGSDSSLIWLVIGIIVTIIIVILIFAFLMKKRKGNTGSDEESS